MKYHGFSAIVRSQAVLLAMLMLAMAFAFSWPGASVVWATPGQSPMRQTVPTLTPTPIPGWHWVGAGGNPADYAPSGVPDFDQKQGNWKNGVGAWTYSAPVAAANALWWVDSYRDQALASGIVTAYGAWDDHDARNVVPLVDALASALDTDANTGTNPEGVAAGLSSYLNGGQSPSGCRVVTVDNPELYDILAAVDHSDAVVLALGFWENQGDRWAYLGGHYVAVAGMDPQNRLIAISDPWRDAFEAGTISLGRKPAAHAYPHVASYHNDARYVSHDAYTALSVEGDGGLWALNGYATGIEALLGRNIDPQYAAQLAEYSGAEVAARISHAYIITDPFQAYLPAIKRQAP